jgi:hypothetical protein
MGKGKKINEINSYHFRSFLMTAKEKNSLLQRYFYCQAVNLLNNNLRTTASTAQA